MRPVDIDVERLAAASLFKANKIVKPSTTCNRTWMILLQAGPPAREALPGGRARISRACAKAGVKSLSATRTESLWSLSSSSTEAAEGSPSGLRSDFWDRLLISE